MPEKRDPYATHIALLERLKDAKDPAAWHEFQKFYWDLIAGWARMYGCSERQVKDIFQETMFCLLRDIHNIDHLRKEGGFRHYLRKLVLHCVIDAFFRHPSKELPRKYGKAVQVSPDEDKLWKKSVLSLALRQASHNTDPIAYRAFCYIDLDGMNIQDAAKKLGVTRDKTAEYRKIFLKAFKNDFLAIMLNLEEGKIVGELMGSDEEFLRMVEELASERPECRHTIIWNIPPLKLIDILSFTRNRLKENPPPAKSAAYLLLIYREKAESTSTKMPELGLDYDSKSEKSQWIELKQIQILGRLDSCDIVLKGEGVSRLHASITENRNNWFLKDENSTNGVFVNGERIKEHFLKNGDIIQMSAHYLMIFSKKRLNEYMNRQFKYIHWWSRHFGMSLEQATWEWISTGLAEKFSQKYRKEHILYA